MKDSDRVQLIGGAVVVLIIGLIFALFPMYKLHDGKVLRRPVWSPPTKVLRTAYQGLTPEDIKRLSRDPRQKKIVDSLAEPHLDRPRPSWMGFESFDPYTVDDHRSPANILLYLFVGSVALYVFLLKRKGVF